MLISRKSRESFVTYKELLNTGYFIEQTASKESPKFTATPILPMIYLDGQHQVLFASMQIVLLRGKAKSNKVLHCQLQKPNLWLPVKPQKKLYGLSHFLMK